MIRTFKSLNEDDVVYSVQAFETNKEKSTKVQRKKLGKKHVEKR